MRPSRLSLDREEIFVRQNGRARTEINIWYAPDSRRFPEYPGQFLPQSHLFELRQSGQAIRSQGTTMSCPLSGATGQLSQTQAVPANAVNKAGTMLDMATFDAARELIRQKHENADFSLDMPDASKRDVLIR